MGCTKQWSLLSVFILPHFTGLHSLKTLVLWYKAVHFHGAPLSKPFWHGIRTNKWLVFITSSLPFAPGQSAREQWGQKAISIVADKTGYEPSGSLLFAFHKEQIIFPSLSLRKWQSASEIKKKETRTGPLDFTGWWWAASIGEDGLGTFLSSSSVLKCWLPGFT